MTAKFRVQISGNGQRDLARIRAYLADKASSTVADSTLAALLERISALETFPERGAIPREMEAFGVRDYRQLNDGHYRIFYRVVGQMVVVTLVADGRQDMKSLLRRRLLLR
jgi:toxin ParE1/3/4